ncbi:MAG: hypothetical protein HZC54_13995 [Verrucomicrobia bacterium]|nr:hypothetical protein [Verrucomicrobiota bacterium]
MKRLLTLLVVGGLVMPACAQFSPVQVTVQRVSKKKNAGEKVTSSGNTITIYAGDYSERLALRITLRNTRPQPIEGIVVKWGVAKSRLDMQGSIRGGEAVYGGEQAFSLGPLETKVFESDAVEAGGKSFNSGEGRGTKIRGHGVQLSIGGKVMWEEFVPATVKRNFDNRRPPDADSGEPEQQRGGKDEGKGKKKRE